VRSILLTALLLGSLASAADADEAEEAKNLAEPTDVRKEEGRAAAPAARFEKDRVRSVQLKPYLKAGRISLTASGGLSLNDAFYTKLGGSLGLAYHLRDTLAFGLRASLIRVREEDDLRTARANFQSGIVSSSPEWLAMGEVEWAPLYGKVAVYGSILHFDGYFLGGLGTVWARSAATGGEGLARLQPLVPAHQLRQPTRGRTAGADPEPVDGLPRHHGVLSLQLRRRRCSVSSRWLMLLALLASAAAWSADEEELPELEKDEKSPLRQSVPAVSGSHFPKRGRLEISPSASFSFRDSFFVKRVVGLDVAQHLHDTVAVGARAGFAFNSSASSMNLCVPSETDGGTSCHFATVEELDGRAPGQLLFNLGANLQWAPVYGKISLLSLGFPDFDFYLLLGAELLGYKGPTEGPGSALTFSVGGEAAAGSRIFLTRWLALRVELKDLVYLESVKRLGTTSTGLRQQFFVQVGLSVFFPASGSEE
jgi:outer membrane beta-barrel protein